MSSPGLPAGSRAAVVSCSNRSFRGVRPDTSGPLLAEVLAGLGFAVGDVVLVPDEPAAITAALRAAIAAGVDLVVTTGGTGFTPADITPEATRPLLDREVPGLAEALRQANRQQVPTTILSRGVAGIAGSTIVVNVAGSPGAVRDAGEVLEPVIGHAVAQLRGGDHPAP